MKKSILFWVLLFVLGASGATFAATTQGRAATPATPASTARVDLNTATADQLVAVPGIGKAMAERIIAYRAKSGSFTRVDELVNVQGIGEKKLAKLAPYFFVGAKSARPGSK